jgi:type I restriction enzyme S subunit
MGVNAFQDSQLAPLSDYVYFQEGPGIRKSQNVDDGVCYLNIRCFVDGRLDKTSMNKVSNQEAYGKYKHFLLEVGDFVVSSSGTLGRLVEVFPEDLPVMLNTSTIRFKPKDGSELDRVFLKYFLLSEGFQSQVRNLATGSVQLNYGPSHLQQVKIPVVPLSIQKTIVSIIEPIDKKISTNIAISKNLEECAQASYKSWFINFDPVKAKVAGEKPVGMDVATAALFPDSMEDSELGPIPKGWEIRSIDSFGKVVTGKTPSTKNSDYWGEEIPFVTIPDMHGQGPIVDTKRFLSKSGADSQKNQYLQKGSILVSCIATPGLVAYATELCQSNQQINSVIPNEEHPSNWLYLHLKNMIPAFVNRSGIGTVFPNLNKNDFSSIQSIVSTKEIRFAYAGIVDSVYRKIEALRRETHTLESLRDSLLPRLISGELQIPEEMLVS